MRPLTWALKEVDPVGLHIQSGIHAQEIVKFKIAPHNYAKIHRKNKLAGRWNPPPPGQWGPVLKHT